MIRAVTIGLAVACALAPRPGLAQFVPPPPALQNRIPAPLPPPEQPPVINGPASQNPSPRVSNPRRLNTHSQRARRCLHEGAGYGLKGAKLDAYTRSCANAD
jgi:hypothetical protein